MNSIINTSAIQKHYTPIALGLTEMYGLSGVTTNVSWAQGVSSFKSFCFFII